MSTVRAWGQNDASIPMVYATRSPVTFLYLVVPLIVGYFALTGILRANVVRRFAQIEAYISGSDNHANRLDSMDKQIRSAYHSLGVRWTESYVGNFRSWAAASPGKIIKDHALLETRVQFLKQRAESELAVVRPRALKFQKAESLYRQGVKLLQTQPSAPLLESLEDAHRALTSTAFVQLVKTKQWGNVDTFLKEAQEQLAQILGFAETWHEAESNAPAAAPAGTMMLEDALGLFGLSCDYTAEELSVLYKRLAKVYHPDIRPDQEAKQRNEEMFKKINAAEEILRKNLEEP